MLSGKADDGDRWTLGGNELEVSDRATHLGITRAGKKESEINISERISLARRTSYLLMNTGLHGTNGLNPETSYVIYKCYVIPRMLYGLEVIHLTKTQLNQLERYHLRTLRQIQALPQRTASSAVYMLLGALPTEAEIHKKQLSILHAVISSDNKCSRGVVQRQLACSFNNEFSFFPYQGFFFVSSGAEIRPLSQWDFGDFFPNLNKKIPNLKTIYCAILPQNCV